MCLTVTGVQDMTGDKAGRVPPSASLSLSPVSPVAGIGDNSSEAAGVSVSRAVVLGGTVGMVRWPGGSTPLLPSDTETDVSFGVVYGYRGVRKRPELRYEFNSLKATPPVRFLRPFRPALLQRQSINGGSIGTCTLARVKIRALSRPDNSVCSKSPEDEHQGFTLRWRFSPIPVKRKVRREGRVTRLIPERPAIQHFYSANQPLEHSLYTTTA